MVIELGSTRDVESDERAVHARLEITIIKNYDSMPKLKSQNSVSTNIYFTKKPVCKSGNKKALNLISNPEQK